jgi:hypothetical protein
MTIYEEESGLDILFNEYKYLPNKKNSSKNLVYIGEEINISRKIKS